MNHRWASTSLGCFLLFVLLTLCASAAPKDPCKLLQRDLDQQIDDLKAWQKLDLQECSKVSGSDSDACRQLQDRHAQDLRMFRDNRAYQMANCRGPQPRRLAAASPFEINHDYNDFYEKYYKNRGPCVEYPYVNCQQYDHYVHLKHHHHHYYTEPAYGGAKTASAYTEKPSKAVVPGNADKSAKPDAAGARKSAHDGSPQSGHRDTDRDSASSRSGHDNSSNHGSARNDSSSTAASHHNHDSGGASSSGTSHGSGGSSDSHASSSSGGSSYSGGSHSSGGGGSSSPSSSSASSSSASSFSAPSSSSAGAAASSPASSPSHDSGGSRPK